MKTTRTITLAVVSLSFCVGCDDTPSRPNAAQGYLIEATANLGSGGSFVVVTRRSAIAPPATEVTATFDGTQLPIDPCCTTDEQVVFDLLLKGQPPGAHSLVVSANGVNAAGSIELPVPGSRLDIVDPPLEAAIFSPGNPLRVRWRYEGVPVVEFRVRGAGPGDHLPTIFVERIVAPQDSTTIPADVTSAWGRGSEASLEIEARNAAEIFGELAVDGSNIIVVPADASMTLTRR